MEGGGPGLRPAEDKVRAWSLNCIDAIVGPSGGMKAYIFTVFVLLALNVCCTAHAEEDAFELRVTADNVNLRSRPDITSESAGQVDSGDLLLPATNSTDQWIQVKVPGSIGLWVYKELVKDGRVSASRLRVRTGPGISFRSVGEIPRGRKVEVRDEYNQWLKIDPPPGCSLWISARYVERFREEDEKTDVPVENMAMGKREQDADGTAEDVTVAPRPAKDAEGRESGFIEKPAGKTQTEDEYSKVIVLPRELEHGNLVDSEEQGRLVEYKGVLRPSGFVWRKPSEYRLVRRDSSGRAMTICYVIGDSSVLEDREGHTLILYGRQYWVQGMRHPVVAARQLVVRD